MNKVNKKEERITAYALGELEGLEKDQFEKELDGNVGLQNEVDAIKGFCEELRRDLKNEPYPARDIKLHKNLMNSSGLEKDVVQKSRGKKVLVWGLPTLLAAGIAFVIAVPRFQTFQTIRQTPSTAGDAREIGFVPAASEIALEESEPLNEAKKDAMNYEMAKKETSSRAQGKFAQKISPAKPSTSAPAQVASATGAMNKLLADKATENLPGDLQGSYEDDDGYVHNTEAYDYLPENPFKTPTQDALSTFSIDVDTASYANLRRFVNGGSLPPKDAVRIEEMVNYFPYTYDQPTNDRPFAVHVEVASAPWKPEHRLVKIGLKGKDIVWGNTPASNLVFLLDVSGSMEDPNKLPLLKKSLKMLVERLGQNDRVAIVVYAGASGLALPSTPASQKQQIMDVLDELSAGGSTNGGEGINLAYKIAEQNFIKGGLNRVIIATDGDFNVGTTSQGELVRLIETKAKSGVFLSVLGFGMGNYKDSALEKLADKGNGNYAYIDTEQEARKVLVEEIGGTMMTIAKDVKIQVEFNPAEVEGYRLIGYENRIMAHEDFNNDAKDAGDIGAGHTVTAFYEVVPKGVKIDIDGVDPLKYQKPAASGVKNGEVMTLKLRYKKPDQSKSSLIEYAVTDQGKSFDQASQDFRFASSVAGVGMILRDSKFKGNATLDSMLTIAQGATAGDKSSDQSGYRAEFAELIKKIKSLNKQK